MTHPRRILLGLPAGLLILGVTACGGSSRSAGTTTTKTVTTTTTTPSGKKVVHRTTTTITTPNGGRTSLAGTPVRTLTFTGNGVKDIGKPNALRIPTNSTIQWTNDGAIFQIIPASAKVQSPVNSKAHSGTATIRKGAYHGFLINAIGHWTVKIIPGG